MSELIHIVRFSRRYATLLLAVGLFCLCTSCSHVQSIREARTIVATADSLRSAGISLSPFTSHISHFTSHISPLTSSDSIMLAEAVSALEPVRFFYPTDYAHANYYYGRLLREAGNHPEAMLSFLRVVHSRTKDHEIKARSWSNIGTICRTAGEHEIACMVFGISADEFLMNKDTLAYYYAQNNIAVDLAEMKRITDAVQTLQIIPLLWEDSIIALKMKVLETKGIIYNKAQLYDSTIITIDELQRLGYYQPTGLLNKAQAYAFLNQFDSSLTYARKVLDIKNNINEVYNALYILSHNDSTLTNDKILDLTSQRADIGKLQEARQGQLAQAVQFLEQDLTHKPDLKWLWAILITVAIIGTTLSMYIKRKRHQHQLISQQMDDAREEHRLLSEQNLLLEAKQEQRQSLALKQIEQYCNSIEVQNFREQLCWDDYKEMCSIINHYMFGLVDKLNAAGLKKKEIQLCVLVIIGKFRGRKMASILCYAENSIRGAKEDVATKLGTTSRNLRSFLLKMASEG